MKKQLKRNVAVFLVFSLLFFFVNPGKAAPEGKEDEGKKLLAEGEQLYRDFKFLEALDKFKKAELIVESGKDKIRLYLNMSKVYFQLGVLSKTEELLKEVLKLDPGKILKKNRYPPSYREIFERLKSGSSVITKLGKKKKKKKFPFLLVALGAAAAGLIIYFLVKKSKKKKDYTLTVTRGEGVDGSPESGQYSYKEGTTVNYQYQLQAGYADLQVMLDGAIAPTSGTIVMDRNHTLTALPNQRLAFIQIESTPPEAVVSLNGEQQASTTPSSFYITEGNYEFRVTNSLFGEARTTINIQEGMTYNITVILSPYRYQFSTSWGGEGRGPGQFRLAPGLALDQNGYIYVTDWENDQVQKFDLNGNFILRWKGSDNDDDGLLDRPHGITVDSNNHIYVTEFGNHRVQKFDTNGSLITKWGQKGKTTGSFDQPYGICADQSGYLYVTDWGNNRVQKFDSQGNYILAWGNKGSGMGEFENPFGISADNDNFIYVSDYNNYRIQKFDGNGVFIAAWDIPAGKPRGIAIDRYGYVYVSNTSNMIQKFDPDGSRLIEWGSPGQGNGQFNLPTGLGLDVDGNLYVADNRNNRIQKFELSDQAVGTGIWDINTTSGLAKRNERPSLEINKKLLRGGQGGRFSRKESPLKN